MNKNFRSDVEVEKKKENRSDDDTKIAIIALSGFIISVFLILWALLALVRFYVFDNVFYSLFIFCTLVTGKKLKKIYFLD